MMADTDHSGSGGRTLGLDADHVGLGDTRASRRYFKTFELITSHLARVAGQMEVEGRLKKSDVDVLTRYVMAISFTFRALGMKYLMVGREGARQGALRFDAVDSGFPVFDELLVMANDAQQARQHLQNMSSVKELKEQMVGLILSEQKLPTRLQFALSQRLYYEELLRGDLFWATMHPDALWLEDLRGSDGRLRRRYLIHWASYDTQVNLPTVYLMEVEDSSSTALPRDQQRWPEVQAHLTGQALGGLKLVTIASGFDTDFPDLHPKRLRRFHIGPMYSHGYTAQSGPLREVLAEAKAPPEEDWALVWTEEEILSERVVEQRAGWFSTVEREVFTLDPFSDQGMETGATRTERSIILPQRPFQVLEEKRPPGFAAVRKFVVSPQGRVLSYR